MSLSRFTASIYVFLLVATLVFADGTLRVHFINVGQGDAILIQSPDGKVMLIDGGENNGKAIAHLRQEGIPQIDVLVITHPHQDHIGGLPDILKEYETSVVIAPRVPLATTAAYRKFIDALNAKKKRITDGEAGLVIDLCRDLLTECLSPAKRHYADINNDSVVIRLTYDEVTFLFIGDMTAMAERDLLTRRRSKLQATVLQVPHHGSATSLSSQFLEAVSPETCVTDGKTVTVTTEISP
jgi:competence protein ComEC